MTTSQIIFRFRNPCTLLRPGGSSIPSFLTDSLQVSGKHEPVCGATVSSARKSVDHGATTVPNEERIG